MLALSILVCDDHAIFRSGMANLLRTLPSVSRVLEACNGAEAIEILKEPVDVVFLDIQMPVMNGIETQERLKALYPKVKVVMLTAFVDDHYIHTLAGKRIDGYLLKNTGTREISRCLELIFDDHVYYTPEIAGRLYAGLRFGPDILDLGQAGLTPRELEVLKWLSDQHTNAEIAAIMHISENTVKTYKKILLEKTRSKNVTGLVLFAIKNKVYEFKEG